MALALTAGMLGAVNPCGFALLPAYLALLVAGDSRSEAVGRALRCTLALTLGYVLVFGAFGLLLAPFQGVLQPRLPWLTVVLGGLLVTAGGWLLAGRSLPSLLKVVRAPRLTGSAASMVLFGMGYALASLGCALGPFLAIVVAGMRAGSITEGLLPFVAYAAGMGLVIGVTAVAVALADHSLVRRLRRASAVAPRLGGAVLIVTGAYVAWYGGYELRVNADRRVSGTDPIVNASARVQEGAAALVSGVGAGWLLAALATLTVVAFVIHRRLFVRVGRI
ncbi:cytochrome c biogenesis protein CcdA [Actinoplanes sp. NPDC051633]|uniref:cytochrome c biogenesis CcdA family protein n=1 Tax=Actinoplanes sp. NPDC051633 TaxID=3155670 RepID=UPI003438469F